MPRDIKTARRHSNQLNTKWFEDSIRDAGTSQAKLAGHLGISPSQISKAFKGERSVQIDEVEKIATHLGKSNAEVLINLGVKLEGGGSGGPAFSGRSVPLVGRVEQDGTAHLDLEHPARMVDAPGKVPPGTVAISAAEPTHSASTFLLGGLFFVKITDTLVAAAIGRLSLIRLARGPWMLRTIKPSIEVDRYDLIGPNGVLEGQTVLCGSPVLLIRP